MVCMCVCVNTSTTPMIDMVQSKNVGGVRLGLDGAVKKMTRVMESPQGRQYLYAVVGVSLALFLLYRYVT